MILGALRSEVDERFLMHRLRATSLAGVVGGIVASLLFVYQFFADDVARWDLLGVAVIIALTKLGTLAYYRLTD